MAPILLFLANVLSLASCATGEPAPSSAADRQELAGDEPRVIQAEAPPVTVPPPATVPPASPVPVATDAGVAATSDAPDASVTVRPAPIRPGQGRRCAAERWNGWEGTPACRRAARRSVAADDRSCRSDADCVRVGTDCDPHAVSADSAERYRAWPAPCTPPGAGGCDGPRRVVCSGGCCTPDYLGGR